MISSWHTDMATAVLAKAARVRPASVPNNIDAETIRDWAECLALMQVPQINDLWREAMAFWAVGEPNDRMFTPYSLRLALERTVAVWESDAARRDELQWYRYRRVKARVEAGELPEGTEVGYEPESLRQGRMETITGPSQEQRAALRGLNAGAA